VYNGLHNSLASFNNTVVILKCQVQFNMQRVLFMHTLVVSKLTIYQCQRALASSCDLLKNAHVTETINHLNTASK